MSSLHPSEHHIALLSPAVGTGNVGDHFIETAIQRLLAERLVYHRFSIRRPLTGRELDEINETACAVLCGTNLYQSDWESALTPRTLDQIRVPIVPLGVGSSAASLDELAVGARTREMIRLLHSRCALGSVRDPHTARVVALAGVSNAILTGCPVLFWSGGAALPECAPIRRERIVLTARNWLMHRWPDNVDHPAQIQLLQTLLASFSTRQIVFAIHEDFDERLVDRLNIPREIVFQSDRPEDYLQLYTDPAHVVLAMRLHAGMLAVANGVPAVFVGHDTRTYSFCEMMDLDCIELFAENSAQECLLSLQRMLSGDVSGFARMQPRYHQLHDAMGRFLAANGLQRREPGQRGPYERTSAGREAPDAALV